VDDGLPPVDAPRSIAAAGSERMLLSERDAAEVLAYLVSAARTQVDEAAEYAPMRLLTAAQRLGEHIARDASAPLREFISVLATLAPTATPTADLDAYLARLDAVCVALAECLLAMDGPAA
jgi:hypothetical protein